MNNERYTFSKESELDLLEFFKVAKAHKKPDSTFSTWEYVLPQNKDLLKKLSHLEAEQNKNTVVVDGGELKVEGLKPQEEGEVDQNISDQFSDEETSLTEAEKSLEADNSLEVDNSFLGLNLNKTTVEDLVYAIKEGLETEDLLSNEVIRKLKTDCNQKQLETMFSLLSETLEAENVNKLGLSIIAASCSERNLVASYYFKYMLMTKMTNEQLSKFLKQFFNTFFRSICDELVLKLLESPISKAFQQNLSALDKNHKDELVENFILNCSRLEQHHFVVLDCLMTGSLDIGVLKKLIEIMTASINNYSNDKHFGKFMITVLKLNGRNVGYFEQQISDIVSNHRSIWKGQAQKVLDSLRKDFLSLTQSFSH